MLPIQEQDTIRLPISRSHQLTIRQLRERYKMGYYEVALAAGVKPRVACWFEKNVAVDVMDAIRILSFFSQLTGQHCIFDTIQGISIRQKIVG